MTTREGKRMAVSKETDLVGYATKNEIEECP